MGGGKTKTYRDFDTGEVFEPSSNLMSKDILKYAGIGKLKGVDLGSCLIKSISSFTNTAYFNKMSVGGISTGFTHTLDDIAILNHFGSSGTLGFASMTQPDGNINPGPLLKIIDYLNAQATSNVQTSISLNLSYSPTSQYNLPFGTKIGSSGSISFPKTIYKHEVYTPTLSVDNKGNVTSTYGYREANVIMSSVEGNPCPAHIVNSSGSLTCYVECLVDSVESTTVTAGVPPVATTTYSIKQTPTLIEVVIAKPEVQIVLACYYDDSDEYIAYVWEHEIVNTETSQNFLVMTFKKDGAFIEDKKLSSVFNKFGIKKDDVYEAEGLADTRLKHAMFCYAGKADIDTKFAEVREDFLFAYRFKNSIGKLIINTDSLSIVYDYSKKYRFSFSGMTNNFSLSFNGINFNPADDGYVYLIPIDNLDKLPLNVRYDFIVEHFRLGFLSDVIVKLKWYQTGIFGFITFVIGAVVSFLVGGPAGLAKFVAFYIAMKIVASLGIAELTLAVSIIGIAYGVYDSGGWETLDLMKQTATVVGVAGSFAQYYFTIETDKITKQIQGIEEETDANRDKINEMTKEGLYQPMENTQNFYDTCFDFHNIYLENAFNYDFMYNFDSVVPKGI